MPWKPSAPRIHWRISPKAKIADESIIVEVAFEGNYYPGDVWFFEERTGDLPVEVLLAAALRD